MFALTPFKNNRLMSHNDLFKNFDRMWSNMLEEPLGNQNIPIRSWEENNILYVEADLPGVARENIEVSLIDERTLRIAATREENKTKDHYKETYYGRTERILSLPTAITEDNATASLKDGVLSLTFNKISDKIRRIEVK